MEEPQATAMAKTRFAVMLIVMAAMVAGGLVGCQPKVTDLPAERPGPGPESSTAEAPAADFISPELPAPPSRPSVPEHITPTSAPRGTQACSEVWVVDLESGQKQFVAWGARPLWSPDGSRLAFNSDRPDGRILGVSVWDGNEAQVIAETQTSATRFAWTSDSRQVIVDSLTTLEWERLPLVPISIPDCRQNEPLGPGCILSGWPRNPLIPRQPFEGMCLGPQGQRYMCRLDGSASPVVMDAWIEAAEDITARAKIDGAEAESLIAELETAARAVEGEDDEAAVEHILAFLEAVGRHRRAGTLTDEQAKALVNAGCLQGHEPIPIGWAGDGRVLFITEQPGEPPTWMPVKELTVEPIGGGTPVVVCELPGQLEGIDWSPDLSRLAIVLHESSMRETTDAKGRRTGVSEDRFALKIVDLATKAEIDLGSGQCPHWSPDGKHLLYAEPPPGADNIMQNLYVVDAQGGNKRSVAQGRATAPAHIAWSPDSRLVGYSVFMRFDR